MNRGLVYPEPRLSFHPQANLFFEASGEPRSDAGEVFEQILTLASSSTFETGNEAIRAAMAQAGLVSLWFFLKVIAGFNGPYQKLTPHLHVDMTNYYQLGLGPGTKAAGFVGRSFYKSSVWTHGANTWEITRNPELEIALGSAVYDRSLEFLHQSQETIENNEFYAWLYPEHVPENSRMLKGWNDEALTLPNKSRNKRTANIMPITVGGSTAGIHADVLKLDDIVGDSHLNAQRLATSEMHRIGNWLRSSIRTLVKDWETSRVFVAGTRYAADDPYEAIMRDCRQRFGYWDELPKEYDEKPEGEWMVYYRTIKEHDQIIFPESFNESGLRKLMETDFWTYQTQYANNPYGVESAELGSFGVHRCFLDFDATRGYVISTEFGEEIELRSCDLVTAVDPAATDRGISAKTSRSVVFTWATDSKGRKFLIDLRVGFVAIPELFGWMFETEAKFRGYLRAMYLEAQGPFKMLIPLIRQEEIERKVHLPLRAVGAQGEKIARIRTAWLPILSKSRVYAVESAMGSLIEELKMFPNGRRMDVIDAGELAERSSVIPEDSTYSEDDEDDILLAKAGADGRNPVTGY